MWDVGDKNIISIGVPLAQLEFIANKDTQFSFFESQNGNELLDNLHLLTTVQSIIFIQFTDWDFNINKTLKITERHESLIIVFVFDSREEFDLNFDKMNRANAFGIFQDDFMEEKTEMLLQSLGMLPQNDFFMKAEFMELETQVNIPIILQGISKNQLVIEKPSFSKEIEESHFNINFRELGINFNSNNEEVKFSDNKILVSGDFSKIISKLELFNFQSLPFIKVAIFTKQITKEIQDLYEIPNISLNLYRSASELDCDVDLIIINEIYIDNNPFSDEVLKKIKLNEQKIVVFNAKSTSRAYQKVYRHKKILLNESEFCGHAVSEFIQLLQRKIEGDHYYLNEWDTLGIGELTVDGEISMFNEFDYKLKIPFKLKNSTVLGSSFWNDLTGDIIGCEKEKSQYEHLVRFNNLNEIDSNNLRIFINKIIFYQDNFKEKLHFKSYNLFTLPLKPKESA